MDGTPLLPPPMNHNPEDGEGEGGWERKYPSSCQTYVKIGEMEREELSAADMSSTVSKGLLAVRANNTPQFFCLFFL